MKFPESALAHRWIDPLRPGPGLEIGGSAHNAWGIADTLNVDVTGATDTVYKRAERDLCGECLPVDVVAHANRLPFADASRAWVLNSHVFEHLPDPLGALLEWRRVLRPGGILYSHVPHRDAHPGDRGRPLTTLEHLVEDHRLGATEDTHPLDGGVECKGGHYHVFDLALYLALVDLANGPAYRLAVVDARERDDKVGNSFVVVLRAV